MSSTALKPLRGVRILSLALNLPGPAALMRLQQMGARCTKVEPPGPAGRSGDPMGQYNPQAYATLHAGIKVSTLDLKSDAGRNRLQRMLAGTDVLLTSFRPSALRKLGLDWKTLHLRGLRLDLAPGQALKLRVAETTLSDYFARIDIDAAGLHAAQRLLQRVAQEQRMRTLSLAAVAVGVLLVLYLMLAFYFSFVIGCRRVGIR